MEEVWHFSNSFTLDFSFHESKTTHTFCIILSHVCVISYVRKHSVFT